MTVELHAALRDLASGGDFSHHLQERGDREGDYPGREGEDSEASALGADGLWAAVAAEDDGQQTELPASLQLGGRCTVAGNWLGVGGPWTSLMHACQSGAIDVVNGILAHNSTLTSLAGTHSENYSLWCVYLVNTIGC